jgi:hypothetical protein
MTITTYPDGEIDSTVDFSRPRNDEIAPRAFQLWKERGCPIGSPEQDWFLAEAELIHQQSGFAVAA